jgi:hypothetical protein
VVSVALAKSPEDRFQSMQHLAQALLKTPEGKLLQRRVHGEGLSAEELTDELLSGAPPPSDTRDNRDVRTLSGIPPLEESASQVGSGDRTPPGHLLDASPSPSRSPLPLLFAGLTIVLLVGGAFAWTHLEGADKQVAQAQPTIQEPPEAVAPSLGEAEPTSEEADEGLSAGDEQPEEAPAVGGQSPVVRLEIETVPSGAVVRKGEFQVCDASPCQLEVAVDEAVTLRASKGRMNGVARVLAQKDQKVTIVLISPKKRPSAPKSSPPPAKETPTKTCEVMVDGLKILRPCD